MKDDKQIFLNALADDPSNPLGVAFRLFPGDSKKAMLAAHVWAQELQNESDCFLRDSEQILIRLAKQSHDGYLAIKAISEYHKIFGKTKDNNDNNKPAKVMVIKEFDNWEEAFKNTQGLIT